MPENPGEIALEESALAQLRLDIEVGDQVTWTMRPLEGLPEERIYTLVGVLSDQSPYMESYGTMYSDHGTPEWRGGVSWARRSASVVKVRLRPAFTVILRWKGAQPRKLGVLAISEGENKKALQKCKTGCRVYCAERTLKEEAVNYVDSRVSSC